MSTAARPGDPPAERIYHRIAEFVTFLRESGISVGIGAEVDLAGALETIDVLDREEFRYAARITLGKSPEGLRRLDAAFDAFWSGGVVRPGIPSPGHDSSAPRMRSTRTKTRPEPRLNADEVIPPSGVTAFGVYSATAPASGHVLAPLGEAELRALRRGARRFRLVTSTLTGRRLGRARRGSLDLYATLRHNLRRGGEWLDLIRRRPLRGRTQFLILWDVSGSMREHDARCFALVHALERVSRSSRVFAFSTTIEEVTEEVRRHGYRRALGAVGARLTPAEGGTQIGPCLREFSEHEGAALRDHTVVVIVSDGWDLAESGVVAEQLRRIGHRVDSVIWVSPYARRPGFEPRTGALVAALPHLDALLGPEDFESRFPLRPLVGKIRREEPPLPLAMT